MRSLVVDASMVLAWTLDDEQTPAALQVRDRVARRGALVPTIWRLEIANSLLAACRRGRLTREALDGSIEDLGLMPIETDDEALTHVWGATLALAGQHRLSVYDASYLELALRTGLPLASLDRDLRTAATERAVALL